MSTEALTENHRGSDVDVLLGKITRSSWRSVFALVVLLTPDSCVSSLSITMVVLFKSKEISAVH